MYYPIETLKPRADDGTMPHNVKALENAVIGHRIVSAEVTAFDRTVITLDNGQCVQLADTSHCCAYTELETFLLHTDRIDHVITGVGSTDGYTTWHIYADMGDVLELSVVWSCGNPFYYAYGFRITVVDLATD